MAAQFGWSKAWQGAVLAAFFAGYCVTQLVGGQLADTLGAKHVLTVGVVSWSVCTVLTPLSAQLGLAPLIAGA
jgi:ACS family sodium-dependent inorganic phosphate cotransporter-like MFS transporter 9